MSAVQGRILNRYRLINQDGFEGRGRRTAPWDIGFLDQMRAIPDHRIPGMVSYPRVEILLATLTGVVCRADDWEGIEEVASGALEWLRGFLPFANGIATAQTLRKVFRLLDSQALARGFAAWAASARGAAEGEVIGGRQDFVRLEDGVGWHRGVASDFGLHHRGGGCGGPARSRREVQ